MLFLIQHLAAMNKIIIISGLYAIFLLACKRETNNITNPAQAKVKTMEFTGMGSLTGYKDRINFNYDNADRVVSIQAYNTQLPSGAPFYDSIFNLRFDYAGNSNMPYRGSITRYGVPYNEIHYLHYDAAGQLAKDSVLFYSSVNGWYFHTLTSVIRSGSDYICRDSTIPPGFPGAPPPPAQIYYTNLKYVNNNFTEYVTGYPGSFFLDFDAGVNPLNQLNIASLFPVLDYQHSPICNNLWSVWSFASKNNIIRIKQEFNPSTGMARDSVLLFNHYDINGRLEKRFWCNTYSGPTGPALDTVDMIQFIYQ